MKAKINGISVDYALEGPAKARALVLVHGFPLGKAGWAPQVKALKGDFRVLTYDLRGMGKSGLGRPPQLLEAYVDDLLALMDKTGLESAALCGLSMGGYIALRALQKAPHRFWALALADTRSEADTDEGKLKRAAGIAALRAKGVAPYCKAMLPALVSPGTLKAKPALTKSLLKLMCANSADGLANALAAMAGRPDSTASLGGLKLPVLVLAGEEDKLTPPESAQGMAGRIEGAKLALVPKAGHLSNLENPEFFNVALLNFLKKPADRVNFLG
jgi:3-oxoadipate enol-lactonase